MTLRAISSVCMPACAFLAAALLAIAATGVAMAGSGSGASPGADRREILRLRQDNNLAIAARDLDRTMAIAAEDYVLVGGNDGIRHSREIQRRDWADSFASPDGLICVRTPERVEIGRVGETRRAAEIGRWRCESRTPNGPAVRTGLYLAHWSTRSGAWKVVSDNYVTLACRGAGCEAVR